MSTIWKFPVKPGAFSLRLPNRAEFLSVQPQQGVPMAWFRVSSGDGSGPRERHFHAYPTGGTLEDTDRYLGTFQMHGGELVFHLCEV